MSAGTRAVWLALSATGALVSCCPLRGGVEARTTLAAYTPGRAVSILVANGRGRPVEDIQHPSSVKLERFEGAAWHYVPTWWRSVTEEDAIWYIEPCTTVKREVRLPAALPAGRYRFLLHDRWATNAFVIAPL